MPDLPPSSAPPRVERCLVKTVGAPAGKVDRHDIWQQVKSLGLSFLTAFCIWALNWLSSHWQDIDFGSWQTLAEILIPGVIGLLLKLFRNTQKTAVVDSPQRFTT